MRGGSGWQHAGRAALAALLGATGLGGCAGGTSTSQLLAADAVKTGQIVHIACQHARLHRQPDGYAPVIGEAPFGLAVKVLAVDGFYTPTNRSEPVPAWAMVEAVMAPFTGRQGWTGARCLVSTAMLPSQAEDKARAAAEAEDATLASRGFGEDEAGEGAVASRGAVGRAKAGRANFPVLDRAVATTAAVDPATGQQRFRSGGGLGEYGPPGAGAPVAGAPVGGMKETRP